MTQDEILDMWGRAGGGAIKNMPYSLVERFAALVRADEREVDAKVCEELPAPDIYSDTDKSMWDVACMDCAAAIRARGQA